jgi:hypothetical protein
MVQWYEIVDNKDNVSFIKNIIDKTEEHTHIICAFCKNIKIILYLISKIPSNLFSPNHSGYYPIHELFFSQPIENIKAIIELELFDLFVTDSFSHYTPLHILCWRNDREKVVKLFFEMLLKNQLQKLLFCVYESEALYCGELKTPAQILNFFRANWLLEMLTM